MKPREWVGVHRKHHAETDQPGDPHSPFQQGKFGVVKVFVGNGLHYYKQAAKELGPEEIPQHLQPDRMDKLVYDHGIAGQVALFGLFAAVHKGSKTKGALSLAAHSLLVHDALSLSGGGYVNSWLHRGAGTFREALFGEPKPYEDGTFVNNAGPIATALTVGEGKHRNHHEAVTEMFFDPRGGIHDIGGSLTLFSIHVNLVYRHWSPTLRNRRP